MEKTIPRSTRINLFSLEKALDCAVFIGSGILAKSYLTTWINHPINNSGIAFAGFLNANILGLANALTGTNKSESILYKLVISIGALSFSAFAAPYLAQPLTSRLGIVLSRQASLQIACLNLAIKGSYYVLSYFAPLKMPNTATEVTILDKSKLKKYFDYFTTEKGKKEWQNLNTGIQLSFWEQFKNNNLFGFRRNFPISWIDKKDQDLIDIHKMILKFIHNDFFFCSVEEKDYLYQKYFTLDMPPPDGVLQTPLFFKMLSTKTPSEIKTFTSNQAKWAHSYFTTIDYLPPSKEVREAYFLLFHHHSLKLSEETFKSGIQYPSLPILREEKEVFKLNDTQIQNYFEFTKDINNWKQFSLPIQNVFNSMFQLVMKRTWHLFPNTAIDVYNANDGIIAELHEGIHIPYHWLYFKIEVRLALNERFFTRTYPTYPTFNLPPEKPLSMNCLKMDYYWPSTEPQPVLQSVHEIEQLGADQVKSYFEFTKSIKNWKQLPLSFQYALNLRFQLVVGKTWNLFPNSIEEIKDASREVIENLHEGEHIPYHWLYFSEEIQKTLNEKFAGLGLQTYLTSYQRPNNIPPIGANSTRHLTY